MNSRRKYGGTTSFTMDKQANGPVTESNADVSAHRPLKPASPDVPLEGIPDFHHVEEEESHAALAPMKMDRDVKGRVNTGTGDQPDNKNGSRFGTACESE